MGNTNALTQFPRSAMLLRRSRLVEALLLIGLVGATTGAFAQMESDNADDGAGASQGSRRTATFVPRLSVESTWTNNIDLRGGAEKTSDTVTSVRPSFQFTADGDRLQTSVNYSLTRLIHARDRSRDRNENALRALGRLEMAEDFAFLDFSGNISQRTISALGPRSGSDINDNDNRTETAVYRLSPYVRGQLGDWAQYEARYRRDATRAKSSTVAFNNDSDTNDVSMRLVSASGQRFLSWTLDANRQEQKYASGRSFEADRVRGVLTHAISPQLSLSLIPGWESNNYVSQDKDSSATFGGQVQWAVSDRTRLSALLEKRFFGRAYSVSFDHRTPRTAWRISDSRDASSTPTQAGSTSLGSLYDLYFFQFESIEPDPIRRAQLVESFLAANGLDGSTSVDLGFLTSSVTLSRRRDLSLTLIGLRDTLTFLASQSETSRLSQFTTANDDLSSFNAVRQHGYSLAYSRRLSSLSTLNVTASMTRSTGEAVVSSSSTTRSLNVSFSTRLGESVTGTLGLRRTLSDTTFNYNESAIRGGLSFQF